MTKWGILLLGVLLLNATAEQSVYKHIKHGTFDDTDTKKSYMPITDKLLVTLSQLRNVKGTNEGFRFDFGKNINGVLYTGFIDYTTPYAETVYAKFSYPIKEGIAILPMKNYRGKYDAIGWEKNKRGIMGYRVVLSDGTMLYDGRFAFSVEKGFHVESAIAEGPMVNKVSSTGATISFDVTLPTPVTFSYKSSNETEEKHIEYSEAQSHYEIALLELNASTTYYYTITLPTQTYHFMFTTAPKEGSREAFTFAYASDSRSGAGGGERSLGNMNSYILKRLAATSRSVDAKFFVFTGDLVNGYVSSKEAIEVEYAAWKKTLMPWSPYMPFYIGMGNHENISDKYISEDKKEGIWVDAFPFETDSAEAVFAKQFVNFENGPHSEDGSSLDPSKDKIDFPSYKENVYYMVYDNVAVIMLNSDYLYSPSRSRYFSKKLKPINDGNIHGYLMENQLKWLKKTLQELEHNYNIDHIFVTQHTPAFPCSAHAKDDMWYSGDNAARPSIMGKEAKYGIIEQRDRYIETLMRDSSKVRAMFTGDEHNFYMLRLDKTLDLYPDGWRGAKITNQSWFRPFWIINNGSAGAPYYAQVKVPWSNGVEHFTTQYAVVLMHIDGKKVSIDALNPDMLNVIVRKRLY